MAMMILFLAMGLAATTLGRRFRVYTIATLVLILVFGAWTGVKSPGIEAGLPTPWLGAIDKDLVVCLPDVVRGAWIDSTARAKQRREPDIADTPGLARARGTQPW